MNAPTNPRFLVNKKFVELYNELMEKGRIEEGKHGGKNKGWIAEKLNTKSHIIKKYLGQDVSVGRSEEDRYIPIIRALYFCDLFQIDREEIYRVIPKLGVEEVYPSDLSVVFKAENSLRLMYSNVPLRATPASDAKDDIGDIIERVDEFDFPGLDRQLIAFTVSGDSMYPTFNDGDLIMVEKLENNNDINRNRYHVVHTKKGVYLKQIEKQYDESNNLISLRLLSINPAFDPFTVNIEDINGVYRVRKKVSEV